MVIEKNMAVICAILLLAILAFGIDTHQHALAKQNRAQIEKKLDRVEKKLDLLLSK